jgi:hypothetical protein
MRSEGSLLFCQRLKNSRPEILYRCREQREEVAVSLSRGSQLKPKRASSLSVNLCVHLLD